MTMAILPAIQAGGASVARAMPTLVQAVQKYAPAANNALSQMTGKKTPAVLAAEIAKTGNGMAAQGMLFNSVRAGVPLDMIFGAIPLLTNEDKAMLRSHHESYVANARAAVDAQQVRVPSSEFVAPSVEVTNMINTSCEVLVCDSQQLADLIVALQTLKTTDVKQYQGYFDSIGVRRK